MTRASRWGAVCRRHHLDAPATDSGRGCEWDNSYQAVQTSTNEVKDSATLLDIAQRSFTAAQRRYQAGVGNILELLNAQTALANAQQQRIQALTGWRSTRLRFAGSLGRLKSTRLADSM
ncbi:TolC family protein [Burkholderia sp. 9120]|uniref:TolC family protein n=1 Tax=Burkholderia sp. 9120 TaxID=1500897 RepID=UPI002570A1A8|nr:TolC family protein [Burkholderia sp. 9120]